MRVTLSKFEEEEGDEGEQGKVRAAGEVGHLVEPADARHREEEALVHDGECCRGEQAGRVRGDDGVHGGGRARGAVEARGAVRGPTASTRQDAPRSRAYERAS